MCYYYVYSIMAGLFLLKKTCIITVQAIQTDPSPLRRIWCPTPWVVPPEIVAQRWGGAVFFFRFFFGAENVSIQI